MSDKDEIRQPNYIAVKDLDGKLLFKFDPERDIIWLRRGGKDTFIDLREKKREWNERFIGN